MKRFSEQLHKKSQTVKLRALEKRELKERLVSYMEYHPLPAEMKEKVKKNTQVKAPQVFVEPFHTISLQWLWRPATAFAVVLLVGLPIMAEYSVPGDVLYAIKVQVNEEVRSTLIFDSYEKVEWETERLNRRIAEARLLASEGRLTEEMGVEVATAVRTHTDNVKREIEVLRAEDADEAEIASISLNTTLEVQSASLKDEVSVDVQSTVDETNESKASTGLIAIAIDESRVQPVVGGEEIALPSFDKLMARIEINTTRIYELQGGLTNLLSQEQRIDVTRRVEDVSRSIQSAIELSSATGTEAQAQLIDVLQRTQRLIVYLTEIDVKETLDIQTLIPVVLTNDEIVASRESINQELARKITSIEKLVEKLEDPEVEAKVVLAIEKLTEISTAMTSSTTSYESFLRLEVESSDLAADSLLMLGYKDFSDVPSEPISLPDVEDGVLASTTYEVASSTVMDEDDYASSTESVVEQLEEIDEKEENSSIDENSEQEAEEVDSTEPEYEVVIEEDENPQVVKERL